MDKPLPSSSRPNEELVGQPFAFRLLNLSAQTSDTTKFIIVTSKSSGCNVLQHINNLNVDINVRKYFIVWFDFTYQQLTKQKKTKTTQHHYYYYLHTG